MWPTVSECQERIRERNDELRAVLTVLPEPERTRGLGPLEGVPYVLKDTWDTAGIRTTGGSWRHRDRIPSESSTAHAALRATGAVLLGKSNLCDMAFSIESQNHMFGPVRNPHDRERTAGGSTGGGAAAVASGMAAFDWGTDFGGSIRLPASFCGVVGMRLSSATWPVRNQHFPRISPVFYPFCGMGPLATTVERARAVVAAVARKLRTHKPDVTIDKDAVVLYPPDRAHALRWASFDQDAADLFAHLKIRAERVVALPPPRVAGEIFDGYLCSHFFDFIGKDELSIPEGLGAVLLGTLSRGRLDKRMHPASGVMFVLAAIGKARYPTKERWIEGRQKLIEGAEAVWRSGRLIVSPTTTTLPPRHGRGAFAFRTPTFVKIGNVIDATAVSVPYGTFDGGLPRGMHIMGPPGSEDAVFDLAERIECAAAAL